MNRVFADLTFTGTGLPAEDRGSSCNMILEQTKDLQDIVPAQIRAGKSQTHTTYT